MTSSKRLYIATPHSLRAMHYSCYNLPLLQFSGHMFIFMSIKCSLAVLGWWLKQNLLPSLKNHASADPLQRKYTRIMETMSFWLCIMYILGDIVVCKLCAAVTWLVMEWKSNLRRAQSLRSVPSSCDKPTWTEAGLQDKIKSVSQLVARWKKHYLPHSFYICDT